MHLSQTIDPGPVGTVAVSAEQAAIFESPLLFECFLDALWKSFLYLGEFILAAILFIVLVRRLDQHLLIHECIAVVVDPHDAIQGIDEGPIEGCSQPFRLLFEGDECGSDPQIARAAAFDRHRQLSIAERRTVPIPFKYIAHLQVEFNVALQQFAALCADPAHDAVLCENDWIAPASLPRFRRAQTRLHESGTQIVKQFRVNFVVVFRWNCVEGGKSLTESRCEGCYPSGGRSFDGAASGMLPAPANRSMACRTAPARRIDSLHWRCLTSNLFASGGGAVAFDANRASNSSRVISGRGMT